MEWLVAFLPVLGWIVCGLRCFFVSSGSAELSSMIAEVFFFHFLAGDSRTLFLTGLTGGPHSQ